MARFAAILYALVAYAAFNGWFLYAIGFLGEWIVPKAINDGPACSLGEALAVNLGIVLLFAVQHTIMARSRFKQWWTRIIPAGLERSTFVLITAAILSLLLWQWRPIPGDLWNIQQPVIAGLLRGLMLLGALTVLHTTFLIDHWDLVGLRQAWAYFKGEAPAPPVFKEKSLYRWVRHPMMLGMLVWLWATPHMTWSHLLFAGALTGYVLIGIRVEERSLRQELGESYEEYRNRVPMLLPRFHRS
ncbi:NnrU protein [Planctomycetes bacterium MalM25]|nr:NnrU protein [Planctomycetes bacterium MalM25]